MKLPRLRVDILAGEGIANPMTMGNRVMKEWSAVPVDDMALCTQLAEEARAFVASL